MDQDTRFMILELVKEFVDDVDELIAAAKLVEAYLTSDY